MSGEKSGESAEPGGSGGGEVGAGGVGPDGVVDGRGGSPVGEVMQWGGGATEGDFPDFGQIARATLDDHGHVLTPGQLAHQLAMAYEAGETAGKGGLLLERLLGAHKRGGSGFMVGEVSQRSDGGAELHVWAGEYIRNACERLARAAPAFMVFNDVRVEATLGDSSAALFLRWRDGAERAADRRIGGRVDEGRDEDIARELANSAHVLEWVAELGSVEHHLRGCQRAKEQAALVRQLLARMSVDSAEPGRGDRKAADKAAILAFWQCEWGHVPIDGDDITIANLARMIDHVRDDERRRCSETALPVVALEELRDLARELRRDAIGGGEVAAVLRSDAHAIESWIVTHEKPVECICARDSHLAGLPVARVPQCPAHHSGPEKTEDGR